MNKRNLLKKIVMVIFIVSAIIGTGLLYKKIYYENNIQDYKPARDREFILNLFNKERFWLSANPNFNPEFTLDTKSSSRSLRDRGDLTFKVYLENNKPTGVIAYFKEKLYQARILFLAVDEKYRGKGYAQSLLNYALDDLKHQGFTNVRILTRVINKPARAVYTKAGFKEYWSDGEFIQYQKQIG